MSTQAKPSRIIVMVLLVLVGALALTATFLIRHDRLAVDVASNGQDTNPGHLGLSGKGFGPATSTSTAVALIAAGLVTDALSFTPAKFDAQIKAARRTMTGAMQKQYDALLADQKTRVLVVEAGFTVTMALQRDHKAKGNPAYLGVVSLTPNEGEFVMKLVRTATTKGSKQAQAVEFVVDATVVKVGSTWILNSLETI